MDMNQVAQQPAAVVRFSDVPDPIRRLSLGCALHSIYKPKFEDEAETWELDDPEARELWEEEYEDDQHRGKRPDGYDYLNAICVVNPLVGPFGQEVPLEQAVADEIHQVALQIAAARKAGRDRDEFTDELEEKRRGIVA